MAGNKQPIIGPWKAKITQIKAFAGVACGPDLIALAYGAAVTSFNIFWAVVGPECTDVDFKRRRGHRGTSRTAHLSSYGNAGPTFQQPSGALGTTVWNLGDWANRLGYFMALADGLLSGVVYGTSLVFRYSGCAVPGAPFGSCHMTNTVPLLFPAQVSLIDGWIADGANIMVAGPTGVIWGNGVTDYVTAVCYMRQGFNHFPPLPDCTFTYELIDTVTGKILPRTFASSIFNPASTQPGYSQDYFVNQGSGSVAVFVTKTAGVLWIDDAKLVVQGGKYKAPWSPYSCGVKIPSQL